jgi:hypothetical protein
MANKDEHYIVPDWWFTVDYHYLPATIEEGLDAALLDRRWRPRDQRGLETTRRWIGARAIAASSLVDPVRETVGASDTPSAQTDRHGYPRNGRAVVDATASARR